MQEFLPTNNLLKPYIKTFMLIETEYGMVNNILPDTSIVMAFRFKGQVTLTGKDASHNLPAAVITGIRESGCLIQYANNTSNLLVIFKEGGAAAFFKEPLHELGGINVSLDYLIQRDKVMAVEDALANATNNSQRLTIVEQFLLSELKKPQSDALVQEAIKKIQLSKGDIKIKNLLSDLPISRDPFEKRFRRITGTTPKQFSVIIRLKNLIDNYSGFNSLTDAAHAAGYFDQAHFIKDFKSFTGKTPHDFFEGRKLPMPEVGSRK
jgi:AraC-like DNA-binding protein